MKDFAERYTFQISSKASKKGLDAKMNYFSGIFQRGIPFKIYSKACKKGFLLRHLKRDLMQK